MSRGGHEHLCTFASTADRQTIEEIAAALTAGWPVESIVRHGSKARGDDTRRCKPPSNGRERNGRYAVKNPPKTGAISRTTARRL